MLIIACVIIVIWIVKEFLFRLYWIYINFRLYRIITIKYFIVGNDGNWYNKGIYYPSNNVWTHVVLSVSKNKQYFYINGSLHAQSNVSTTSFYDQITIGASKNVNLFFKGCLQQIRIFNKLLTPTEVKYLYDNKI